MKQIGSYYWPRNDKVTPEIVLRESSRIPEYLRHCKQRRVCVQAGGNCGVYAQILSFSFKEVLTFEPDQENWECLEKNVTALNVRKYNAALGEKESKVQTWREDKERFNYGATLVKESAIGTDTIMLDSLELQVLDFLFLDVEGSELPALKGAKKTILELKPVVSVEIKGLGRHFGYTDENLMRWMRDCGYNECARLGRDVIFKPTI
jgi:FkbM family methyltransferase